MWAREWLVWELCGRIASIILVLVTIPVVIVTAGPCVRHLCGPRPAVGWVLPPVSGQRTGRGCSASFFHPAAVLHHRLLTLVAAGQLADGLHLHGLDVDLS